MASRVSQSVRSTVPEYRRIRGKVFSVTENKWKEASVGRNYFNSAFSLLLPPPFLSSLFFVSGTNLSRTLNRLNYSTAAPQANEPTARYGGFDGYRY